MSNSYTEEFKRNAVAVVKSGMSEYKLAKRLGIPPTSIRNWVKNNKYSMVEPATEEILANIPVNLPNPEQTPKTQGLVPIRKVSTQEISNVNDIKIRIGKMQIECEKESLVTVFKALGESGVL